MDTVVWLMMCYLCKCCPPPAFVNHYIIPSNLILIFSNYLSQVFFNATISQVQELHFTGYLWIFHSTCIALHFSKPNLILLLPIQDCKRSRFIDVFPLLSSVCQPLSAYDVYKFNIYSATLSNYCCLHQLISCTNCWCFPLYLLQKIYKS